MIGLIDSTLREGEQMAGVYFSLRQKLELLGALAAVGIEEIEIGLAVHNPEMGELLRQTRQTLPGLRLALWCRCLAQDVEVSAALRPDVLAIAVPVSDLHIRKRLGKTREWILRQIPLVAAQARASGVPYLSLGFEDATRAAPPFLAAALRAAAQAGVERVRLCDTIGVATPQEMHVLVKAVKAHSHLQVGVHTHNDFGMATANAITALEAGADWADVTVLGLGERAGNARLEEVVGFLSFRRDEKRYHTTRLYALCKAVARMTGSLIPPHHPIVGKKLFTCESGIHLDGLEKDRRTYEPFPPELVQTIPKVLLGKKAGQSAVRAKLRLLGLPVLESKIIQLTSSVRELSRTLGRPLAEEEVVRLYHVTGSVHSQSDH